MTSKALYTVDIIMDMLSNLELVNQSALIKLEDHLFKTATENAIRKSSLLYYSISFLLKELVYAIPRDNSNEPILENIGAFSNQIFYLCLTKEDAVELKEVVAAQIKEFKD